MLDNDQVTVYAGDECVFKSHPEVLLEEALTLLGVHWEHV